MEPHQLTNARLVLGSHDHADHIDRDAWPEIAKASPQAAFVVPLLLRPRIARELGLPDGRVLGVDEGRSVTVDGVTVAAIPAAHELLDADPATGLHPYVGFVVSGNGFRLYHAGDCCMYEGIHQQLRQWPLDLMILPINGRDAKRLREGCIGKHDLPGSLRPGRRDLARRRHPQPLRDVRVQRRRPVRLHGLHERQVPAPDRPRPRHGERVSLTARTRE